VLRRGGLRPRVLIDQAIQGGGFEAARSRPASGFRWWGRRLRWKPVDAARRFCRSGPRVHYAREFAADGIVLEDDTPPGLVTPYSGRRGPASRCEDIQASTSAEEPGRPADRLR
jgi:hypothetical protein